MLLAKFYHVFPKVYSKYPTYKYAAMTFVGRSCSITKLASILDGMSKAWEHVANSPIYPAVGSLKALEITCEGEDSITPHYHVLMAVLPSYLGRRYVPKKEWRELWQEALCTDWLPEVRIHYVSPRVYITADSAAYGSASRINIVLKGIKKMMNECLEREIDTIENHCLLSEVLTQLSNTKPVEISGVFSEFVEEGDCEIDGVVSNASETSFGWKECLGIR